MDKKEKFESFLKSMKGNGYDILLESVRKGFTVLTESLSGIEPLIPAYGRDYKDLSSAQKDFDADKDFKTAYGQSINKSQVKEILEKEGQDGIQIHYNRLQDNGMLKINSGALNPADEVSEEGGMSATVIKDMKLENGAVVPKGENVKLNLISNGMIIEVDSPSLGKKFKLRIAQGYRYFNGFNAPPSTEELEEMMMDGTVPTPTGHDVEPDGHGPDGSPSWFLVLGLI